MAAVESIIAEHNDLNADEIAEALLHLSGVHGKIPTQFADITGYLDLELRTFSVVHELDFLPKVLYKKDIRALLSYNQRLIATNDSLKENRKVFSIFHEVGHYVLPEHIDKYYVCDSDDLSFSAKSRLEAEANKFAAEMIFQGEVFTQDLEPYPLECKSIVTLAERYGASLEATARRYVERHHRACALIVYDKMPGDLRDQEVDDFPGFKVQYTITSSTFRERYFTHIVQGEAIPAKSTVYQAYKLLNPHQTSKSKIRIRIVGKDEILFDSELFTNSYKVFRLLWPD
jgi:hypothetical protein